MENRIIVAEMENLTCAPRYPQVYNTDMDLTKKILNDQGFMPQDFKSFLLYYDFKKMHLLLPFINLMKYAEEPSITIPMKKSSLII